MTAPHPLRHIPVEPWMYRNAREQAELLMQIAIAQSPKPDTTKKAA